MTYQSAYIRELKSLLSLNITVPFLGKESNALHETNVKRIFDLVGRHEVFGVHVRESLVKIASWRKVEFSKYKHMSIAEKANFVSSLRGLVREIVG